MSGFSSALLLYTLNQKSKFPSNTFWYISKSILLKFVIQKVMNTQISNSHIEWLLFATRRRFHYEIMHFRKLCARKKLALLTGVFKNRLTICCASQNHTYISEGPKSNISDLPANSLQTKYTILGGNLYDNTQYFRGVPLKICCGHH